MNDIKNKDNLMIFTFASLSFSLVSTITYLVYTIVTSGSFFDHFISIFGVIILVIFAVLLVVAGFFIENKRAKIFISIASLFLAIYSVFQIIVGIVTPGDYLINFTNLDIKDVVEYAKNKKIKIVQEFKYDDSIKEYHVISQDVDEGTPLKKIKAITVVVSNGIDPTKIAPITNMVGWKLDDVLEFINDNKLTNVTIDFEYSDTISKDIIISQDALKEIKRNEPLKLVSSLGKESDIESVTLENLVGMDVFNATIYLKRNQLNYSFIYTLNPEKAGTVIKQNYKKWTVIGPERKEELVITIAKEDEVTVPDLSLIDKDELTDWAALNHIKLEFNEKYDDTIKKDKVISFDKEKGSVVEVGTTINVIISKGPLKMIEYVDVDSFKEWAEESDIEVEIEYKFSNNYSKGELISSNYSDGDTIKNNDTIHLVISDGTTTTVPKLTGLTKSEADELCSKNNIKCVYEYLNDNYEYTIVTKQSMRSGSIVPEDTLVNLILGK